MGLCLHLHECLKYFLDRERKINGNVKPFTKAKSHFADAGSFEEDDALKETMPSIITSTGRGATKNVLQLPKEDIPTDQLKKEENK